MYFTAPLVTLVARPSFAEPAHLAVQWRGEGTDGERLAEFAGRLCYMSQHNPAGRTTAEYLENIKRQRHGSVLEHASYGLLLEGVSRSLTHELVRHRAGMAYCLAGDTEVYSEHLHANRRDGVTRHTIRSLYERTRTPHGRSRLRLIRLRCLDEATNTFTTARIARVVASGVKPVFRVELDDGKQVTCTKEHRFLTPDGWRRLEEIVGGVTLSAGGLAVVGQLGGAVCVNGVAAYRDRAWLAHHYCELAMEQRAIAELAGCTTHTIRAWVRKHALQKSAGSWSRGRRPWNAGVRYQAGWHHTAESRQALSEMKRGARNPQWRGGITPLGAQLRRDVDPLRAGVLARDGYACRLCGGRDRLVIHHVLPVWARPDLVADPANLAVVCTPCHLSIVGRELDAAERFGRSRADVQAAVPAGARRPHGTARLLVPHVARVRAVTYAGAQETFDLEMEGPHHNFVANGVITHNSQLSQRYVDESEANFVVPPAIVGDAELEAAWRAQVEAAQASYVALVEQLMERYRWVDDKVHRRKMAREAARGVLPNSTETKILVTGNARAWRAILEMRGGEAAELEIRRLAVAALRTLQVAAPAFFGDFAVYEAADRREALRVQHSKV